MERFFEACFINIVHGICLYSGKWRILAHGPFGMIFYPLPLDFLFQDTSPL